MGNSLRQLPTLLCFTFVAAQALAYSGKPSMPTEVVTLDSSTLALVRRANKFTQSFTLDTSLINSGWLDENISSEKLLKLSSLLGPSYLRIGGTDSDSMLFNESYSLSDRQFGPNDSYSVPTFYMSGHLWAQINEFAQKTGFQIALCLNSLHRNGSAWYPSNARELLEFSNSRGFNLNFQLGNEPDLFQYVFNVSLPASQHAKDFSSLRALLDSYPRYKHSLLIGPDIFLFETYLQQFLQAQEDAISVVSFHHYYIDGGAATVQDFYNSSILNSLVSYISERKEILTSTNTNVPIWLSETSSSYRGGKANVSDRFVAGFMWLDKLAVAPKLGVDVICRQDIYGNQYGLLNLNNLDPNPDWWLSILYKKLVGAGVLNTAVPTGDVRLYAQCSKTSPGSVVLFGMNLNSQGVDVRLEGSLAGAQNGSVSSYILTGETGLLSQTVLLNGKRLEVGSDYSLPTLAPVTVPASELHLPAHSLAFFVLDHVQAAACLQD